MIFLFSKYTPPLLLRPIYLREELAGNSVYAGEKGLAAGKTAPVLLQK